MKFNDYDTIVALTPQWKGERMADGRPKVDDKYLDALKEMTLEEVWKPIFVLGYESQFEGRLQTLHDDGRKLIGRAVTCSYCPQRPDLLETVKAEGEAEGRKGMFNQWVIDTLVERDVVVSDMYDKIYEGTFVGGNLSTAIRTRTKTGGAVIWGGIRDIEQIKGIPDIQIYYRGIDPTPLRKFCMVSFNDVTRIGGAVCLPGDVVFGAGGGVLFIPSHLVKDVVEGAAKSHVKDEFGFDMITKSVFTTAQIDLRVWTEEMLDMLMKFIQEDPRGEKYRYLDWSEDYRLAREAAGDTSSAL